MAEAILPNEGPNFNPDDPDAHQEQPDGQLQEGDLQNQQQRPLVQPHAQRPSVQPRHPHTGLNSFQDSTGFQRQVYTLQDSNTSSQGPTTEVSNSNPQYFPLQETAYVTQTTEVINANPQEPDFPLQETTYVAQTTEVVTLESSTIHIVEYETTHSYEQDSRSRSSSIHPPDPDSPFEDQDPMNEEMGSSSQQDPDCLQSGLDIVPTQPDALEANSCQDEENTNLPDDTNVNKQDCYTPERYSYKQSSHSYYEEQLSYSRQSGSYPQDSDQSGFHPQDPDSPLQDNAEGFAQQSHETASLRSNRLVDGKQKQDVQSKGLDIREQSIGKKEQDPPQPQSIQTKEPATQQNDFTSDESLVTSNESYFYPMDSDNKSQTSDYPRCQNVFHPKDPASPLQDSECRKEMSDQSSIRAKKQQRTDSNSQETPSLQRGWCSQSPQVRELADVRFKVQGHTVLANRACLSMISPLFKAMFTRHINERDNNSIELPEKSCRGFVEFVEITHIYAPVTKCNALDVLPIAHEYQCNRIVKQCEKCLILKQTKNSTVEALVEVLAMAVLYDLPGLKADCLEKLKGRLECLTHNSLIFTNVPPEVQVELLKAEVGDLKTTISQQQMKISKLEHEKTSVRQSYDLLITELSKMSSSPRSKKC